MALIKSISGIRGTIGGNPGENLTPIEMTTFAGAYASFLKKKFKNPKVIIGRDGRATGLSIKNIVSNTLILSGIDVVDVDLSTTPTVEMIVILEKAQGGIIISASHNPMNWNALKLLNDKGEFLNKQDGESLIQSIESNDYSFVEYTEQGKLSTMSDAIERHVDSILELDLLDIDLIKSKNFKVVVDPVNSTGAIAMPILLDAMGCEYTIINGEINGEFSHNAEPKPEHLTELCDYIRDHGADLGVAVDPDVDRLALVDETGHFIGEEYTIVLASDFILSKDPGNTVSNLSSSRALKDITEKLGGSYKASAVGEVNVVRTMRETNAKIGGEGNGGVIYPGLHYGRDGLLGVAFALNLMAERSETLSTLRSNYSNYTIIKEKINLTPDIDTDQLIKSLESQYQNEEINTLDGLKIDFEEGWVHLRKSNTEPIIRVYAESSNEQKAHKLAEEIKKQGPMVDQSVKIYLDHAATTPLDPDVVEVMTKVMTENYGNPSSIHAFGRQSRILIENARRSIASCINSSIGEIYFTSSATESNNAVIRAAVRDLKVKRIISSRSEHHCVLHSIESFSDQVDVQFLALDKNGNIDLGELESLLKDYPNETIVSLMHVNNEIGTMMDIDKVSELCKENGAFFHTDAVQSLGKFEIDVQNTPVNFLSGTAHKINGPKGCGFVYINGDTSVGPLMFGGSQERNMRAGTENLYGIVGLGKTVEIWCAKRAERMTQITNARNAFKAVINESGKDIQFNGNQEGLFAPHVLSLSFPKDDRSEMIMMNLDIAGICASAGSACSSGSEHESHVLEAINADKTRKVVRFSFSYMTSVEEAKAAAERFVKII